MRLRPPRSGHGEGLLVGNNNLLFVGAAFAVTWAVLIGYFLHLRRATHRARALLDMVTKADVK